MAAKVAADGFSFHLNTGTIGVPIWTVIGGIESFSPSSSVSDADTTDIDSGAAEEHLVIRRGFELSLSGHFLEDANGDRDAGQEAVETLAQAVGTAAHKQLRITTPGASTIIFLASVKVDAPSGSKTDVSKWAATFKRSGASTFA